MGSPLEGTGGVRLPIDAPPKGGRELDTPPQGLGRVDTPPRDFVRARHPSYCTVWGELDTFSSEWSILVDL